ncbi:DUF6214 family protein [Streptomyces sp. NPDC000658]|uniref:DUF6214 family protein n=1 Tax=Streptomyces sp. NPDC000658 TaxID=3154266 RepID=UPI00331E8977
MWPAWEVQEGGGATSWFQVRLAFTDGACVELLAVVCDGRVSIEDVRSRPALSLVDLTVLADWIEGPLFDNCDTGGDTADVPCAPEQPYVSDAPYASGVPYAPQGPYAPDASDVRGPSDMPPARSGECADETYDGGRARPAWPRGIEGRRLVAQEYRAAQEDGVDPVLAVMCATGHSRRRSLRLIAQARDAGYLTPRHARR